MTIIRLMCFIFFVSEMTAYTYQISDKNQVISVLNKADKFLRGQEGISDIGSLLLKALAAPGSVVDSDVPLGDAFSRIIHEKYAIKDITIKRVVNSVHEMRIMLHNKNNIFGNYFYGFNEEIQKTLVHKFDDVLIKSLYCDKTDFDDVDLEILLSMRDYVGGYADTHGMLGMFFLEGNKCINAARLKKARDSIVSSLIKALEIDTIFSDIYAERIACLYWAGVGHLVQREWIEKILAAQRSDGGWADEDQQDSNVHATGLAVLSIKYYFTLEKPYFYKNI